MAETILYVSNADSGELSVLVLDTASGALTARQTVACGGIVMPLALSPDQRRLYAGLRNEPYGVLAFGIDARDGKLTPIGRAPLPHSMAYLSVDRSARWLFAASYPGALLSVSALDAAGAPAAAHQVLPTGPKAHSIITSPDNRFVHAAVLGSDEVLSFRFDATAGRLEPLATGVMPRPGCGPRHLAWHPARPVLYVLCELDGSIDVFDADATAGTLTWRATHTTLPPDFSGEPWCAELRLTPDGRRLFTSERRGSTLAAFDVDASGALTPRGHVATQAQPRGMAVDPSGRWLVVAGQASHRVGVHAIDDALRVVAELDVGRNPNWVEAIALQRDQ